MCVRVSLCVPCACACVHVCVCARTSVRVCVLEGENSTACFPDPDMVSSRGLLQKRIEEIDRLDS